MITFLGMSNPTILQPRMSTTFLWLCGAAAGVVAVDFRQVRFPRMPILVLAFLSFCLLSLLWTGDREATWFAVLFYAGMAFLACLLVENMSGRLFVRSMSMGAILTMTLSAVAVLGGHPNALGPGRGDFVVVQGLYGNRNIMAYVMVIGLAALLADSYPTRGGRLVKWLLVVAGVGMTYYVRSGTGLVAALVLVAIGVLGKAWQAVPPRRRRACIVAFLGLAAVGVAALTIYFQRVVALLGKDATFSGRTPLWSGIVEAWSASPLGGYGWGSVWAYAWFQIDDSAVRARINSNVGSPLNHGHNAILDILVQVGLIGTCLYLVIVVVSIITALRRWLKVPTATTAWVVLAGLAVSVSGMTEPTFAAPIGWFTIISMAAFTTQRDRKSVV